MGLRVFLSLALCVFATRVVHGDAPQSSPADMMKAQTDYQRMLTERKLSESQALLEQAQAAAAYAAADKDYANAEYFRARTSYLNDYHQVMLKEYARVVNEEAKLKERMYEVRVHEDMCAGL